MKFLQTAEKSDCRYSIHLSFSCEKAPGLYLQELARYLNRDSNTMCRLVKRAKNSHDLSRQTEKLLETALSLMKENLKSYAVMQNRPQTSASFCNEWF